MFGNRTGATIAVALAASFVLAPCLVLAPLVAASCVLLRDRL